MDTAAVSSCIFNRLDAGPSSSSAVSDPDGGRDKSFVSFMGLVDIFSSVQVLIGGS